MPTDPFVTRRYPFYRPEELPETAKKEYERNLHESEHFLIIRPELSGVDLPPLVGSTAPNSDSSQYFIQAGHTVITTNANGAFSHTYPRVFPNGVLTVVATVGVAWDYSGALLRSWIINLTNTAGQSATAFSGVITVLDINPGGGTNPTYNVWANEDLPVNYWAIGF